MTLYRAMLRDTVIDILKKAKTVAQARVFSPHDTPTWDGEFPAIIVRSPFENKVSVGRVAALFTTTANIIVAAQVAAATDLEAEAQLDLIAEQIEGSVINNAVLSRLINQIASVESQINFNGEGKNHIGQLTVNFAMEFPEAQENFAPVETTPLNTVVVTLDLQSPTDPTGIYADAAFPQSVTQPRRTSGMDGRAEATMIIDLSQKDSQ